MKEVLTGASGSIVVQIYGADLAVLRAKAEEVGSVLKSVPGIANLKVEPQVLVPRIEVALNPSALQRFGLTPGDVRRTMATLLQGRGLVRSTVAIRRLRSSSGRRRPLMDVTSVRELRIAIPTAASLPSTTAGSGGSDVRLADVVRFLSSSPNVVQRDGESRRIDVTCDARGRDCAAAKDVERAVRQASLPPGHHAEVLGEYAARAKAQTRLFGLSAPFAPGHRSRALRRLPLGAGRRLHHGDAPVRSRRRRLGCGRDGRVVSLGLLVGFVTVLGIAARNGIMLASHFRHLEREEGLTFGEALIVRGSISAWFRSL